jgi:hypothetical protein
MPSAAFKIVISCPFTWGRNWVASSPVSPKGKMSNPIIWIDPKTAISYCAAIRWLLEEGDPGYADGYRFVVETFDGELFPFKTNARADDFFDAEGILQIPATAMESFRLTGLLEV